MGASVGKSGGNFLDALPTQGTLHVVMLGLDSAGKTTALYRLKFDQYLNTVPTIGFNCEKVQGTLGKSKGVQFLIWDVGGQEKLRPLWRSYTRCTDGILFVVDSVDVERMEEAKMELMRTAKCPDNQGVPVLILANKQDLPGARDPKELEKLLGLYELLYPAVNPTNMTTNSSSTGNIVSCSSNSCGSSHINCYGRSLTPITQHNKFGQSGCSSGSITNELNKQFPALSSTSTNTLAMDHILYDGSDGRFELSHKHLTSTSSTQVNKDFSSECSPSSVVTTPTTTMANTLFIPKKISSSASYNAANTTTQFKGWCIQPACAITGEGLQEGLEILYDMILKRRKINKAYKKRR